MAGGWLQRPAALAVRGHQAVVARAGQGAERSLVSLAHRRQAVAVVAAAPEDLEGSEAEEASPVAHRSR